MAEYTEEKKRLNIPRPLNGAYRFWLSLHWPPISAQRVRQKDVDVVTPEPKAGAPLVPAQQKNNVKAPIATAPVPAAASLAKESDAIPDFITNGTQPDSSYTKTHPGWERYRGEKREYKVYREAKKIRAIQIIDRSGKGLSEVFLNGILGKWLSAPAFVMESSEKKDGYEIQRGSFAANLKAVYYRDVASGGKLNAIVITWQ